MKNYIYLFPLVLALIVTVRASQNEVQDFTFLSDDELELYGFEVIVTPEKPQPNPEPQPQPQPKPQTKPEIKPEPKPEPYKPQPQPTKPKDFAVYIESYNLPNYRIRQRLDISFASTIFDIKLEKVTSRDTLWRMVPGIVNPKDTKIVSFEALDKPGHYLRHNGFKFYTQKIGAGNSEWEHRDCTFYIVPGMAENKDPWISLFTHNWEERYIGHSGANNDVYIPINDNSDRYKKAATWKIVPVEI